MDCKLLFYVVLGLLNQSSCHVVRRTMVLPKALKQLMANVQSIESFMKAMKLGNITLTSPRLTPSGGSQAGLPELPSLKNDNHLGGHSKRPLDKNQKLRKVSLGRTRVVSYSHDSRAPVILEDALCQPYPTVVEVPQPGHDQGIHYPFNVILNRCAGSCKTRPRILECVPKATQDVDLLTFVVSWNSPNDRVDDWNRAPRLIKLANHTACGCRCITKPSDCNPQTQTFVEDTCSCHCKEQTKTCPKYQVWDPVGCTCKCNPLQNVLCPRRFEWSKEKCSCVCKNTPCRTNKVKNPRNCRCYCSKSLPSCGKGLVRNRRDCVCRPSRHSKK